MRSLLAKDVRILRRSPMLVGLLVLYPLLIAILLGLALSKGPDKPRVAIVNDLGKAGTISVGGTQVDPRDYARELYKSIEPVQVRSRAEAVEKIKDGEVLAAIVVPDDLLDRVRGLVSLSGGPRPQIEVIYNPGDPVKREFVQGMVDSKVAALNQAVSGKLTEVSAGYLDLLMKGGTFSLFGKSLDITGLRRSKELIDGVTATMPPADRRRADLERVSRFAELAIENMHFSDAILTSVGEPIDVKRSTIKGSRAPLDVYAVAIAVALSLMLIAVLLAAGMLALEREEHTLARLLRGLARPWTLIASKVLLAAIAAATAGLILCAVVALFLGIDPARIHWWIVALLCGGLGGGALGVGLGALAREVRTASLLAILLALPLAFLALVPQGAVSKPLYELIRGVSALFPFRPGLHAIDGALNGSGGFALALVHLLALTLLWGLVARLALRRMA